MANKSKPKSNRRKKKLRFRKLLAGLSGIALLFLASYLYYLNYLINLRFDGDTWAIPSRVYARPLELYPGLRLSAESLQYELGLSTYYRVNSSPESGQYRIFGSAIELHTEAFAFSDQVEPARRIQVKFNREQVTRIVDLVTSQELDLLRLPPVVIGSYYPQNGEDRVLLSIEQIPQT